MTIEFVGRKSTGWLGSASGSNSIALNSGLSGGLAASVDAGDLVLVAYATGSDNDRTLSITSGYTLLGSELHSNDTVDTNLRVAYKFMGSTPDTSVTLGATGNDKDAGCASVYVLRGVDPTTPLDVAVETATGANSVLANPPSITPVTAGARIVCVGAGGHQDGARTYSSSDLTDSTGVGINDTHACSLRVASKTDWTSGAFNPAAFTFSGTNDTIYSWCAMSIAFRPELSTQSIAGDAGDYSVTGDDASLLRGILVSGEAGEYLVAGQSAALYTLLTINGDSGPYIIEGTDVTIASSGRVTIEAGSYAITGDDATFRSNKVINIEAGSYAVTGQDATLKAGYKPTADAGAYAITGSDAFFRASGRILAETAAYTITGSDATFGAANRLVIEAGSYEVSGSDISFLQERVWSVEAGSYEVNGTAAGLNTDSASVVYDIQDLYVRNFSKMPFWRAVRAKELLWPKWKF